MNVAQLRELLDGMPDDAPVYTGGGGLGYVDPARSVTQRHVERMPEGRRDRVAIRPEAHNRLSVIISCSPNL